MCCDSAARERFAVFLEPGLRRRVPFSAMRKEPKNRRGRLRMSAYALIFAYPTPSVTSRHLPLTGGVGPGPLFTGDIPLARQKISGAQNLSDDLNSRRATGPWVCKNFGWCGSVPAPGVPSQRFRDVCPWAYHKSDCRGGLWCSTLGSVKSNVSFLTPRRSEARRQKGTESQEHRTGPAARRRLRGDIPAGTG